MIVQLKLARVALQLHGWVGSVHEPWCLDSGGRRVPFDDEGLHRYSVAGALQEQGVREEGLELLHRIVAPRLTALNDYVEEYRPGEATLTECYDAFQHSELTAAKAPSLWVDLGAEEKWWRLQAAAKGEYMSAIDWLQESGRTLADVLDRFTEMIKRSKKAATGERR